MMVFRGTREYHIPVIPKSRISAAPHQDANDELSVLHTSCVAGEDQRGAGGRRAACARPRRQDLRARVRACARARVLACARARVRAGHARAFTPRRIVCDVEAAALAASRRYLHWI